MFITVGGLGLGYFHNKGDGHSLEIDDRFEFNSSVHDIKVICMYTTLQYKNEWLILQH